jgi:hypothetical protein
VIQPRNGADSRPRREFGRRLKVMPILDAYIPEGALSPSAERDLLAKISDL